MARSPVGSRVKTHLLVSSVSIICLATATACGQGTANTPPPHATTALSPAPSATSTSVDLPSFTDWRAAYLGMDRNLHVVTLDGKLDLAGPQLSDMTMNGLGLASAGMSPDGHLLAYVGADGLKVVDVAGHASMNRAFTGGWANELFWSPDGSQLALSDGQSGIAVLRMSDGHTSIMPGDAGQELGELVGWTDNSHLLTTMLPLPQASRSGATTLALCGSSCPPSSTLPPLSLAVLDLATGHIRTLGAFPQTGFGLLHFQLSPDGTEALLFTDRFQADTFQPVVEVIDIASGHVRLLANITLLTHAGFFKVVWKPGTQTVAASGNAWLLDLAHDTATHFPTEQFVQGWSPDGGTLVIGTGYQTAFNKGPYELNALTFSPSGRPIISPLTASARTFPFLGFVRTG